MGLMRRHKQWPYLKVVMSFFVTQIQFKFEPDIVVACVPISIALSLRLPV